MLKPGIIYFVKNDNMEEDEWRDKVNNLKELCEYYKEMALNDEPSNDSSAGDDDYWNIQLYLIIILYFIFQID